MTYEFEVIGLKWHHNRGDFIFARHLGDRHDFNVPDDSLFGDVPIYYYKKMEGEPHIFIFQPISIERLKENHFIKRQRVTLTIK